MIVIEKTDSLYNEIDFRRGQGKDKMQPSYIVAYKKNGKVENVENILKAYKDWEGQLPIVLVDIDECEKYKGVHEMKKSKFDLHFFENAYNNTTTFERQDATILIRDVITQIKEKNTSLSIREFNTQENSNERE